MAEASDVSAEADLRLVAVIAELEAAAGEPPDANPGLGLVARVIVNGCRHTFDRQGMALFIQRKPWMRNCILALSLGKRCSVPTREPGGWQIPPGFFCDQHLQAHARAGVAGGVRTSLEPAPGDRLDAEAFFLAYEKAAGSLRLRALPPEEFVEPFNRLCSEAGIKTSKRTGKLYLLNVKLAGTQHAVAQ